MALRRFPIAPAIALIGLACGPNETHPTHPDFQPDGGAPLTCVPNLDGQIDAAEMTPAPGAVATFLVNPAGTERPVDVAGRVEGSGKRLWDWSRPEESDQVARLPAQTLAGKWYANSFPQGRFTSPIDLGGAIDGVYAHTSEGLFLLGMASAQERPAEGRTLLVYTNPVQVYRFPLKPGASWIAVGEVRDGSYRGLPYAGRDTYEVSVDAAGRLALPDLDFTQALRVRMHVTVSPAVGMSTSRRQVSFVSECFGEVARATSRDGETKDDFTTAAEVRRLGLEGS